MLRKATAQDVPAIIALINENADTLLPRSDAEILELIETTWVAERDGALVGCCSLEVYSPKIAEVRSLAVRKDMRGHGYGARLVEAAVAEGKRRKIYQIFAITSSVDFFKKINFGPCLNEKYAVFWDGK
jgi:N-acetylglutamate synthase-like GNAT family acetyltransferase